MKVSANFLNLTHKVFQFHTPITLGAELVMQICSEMTQTEERDLQKISVLCLTSSGPTKVSNVYFQFVFLTPTSSMDTPTMHLQWHQAKAHLLFQARAYLLLQANYRPFFRALLHPSYLALLQAPRLQLCLPLIQHRTLLMEHWSCATKQASK